MSRHARCLEAAALVVAAVIVSACNACGKGSSGTGAGDPNTAAGSGSSAALAVPAARTSVPPDAGPSVQRDVAMWTNAKEGLPEDLATLAVHEGAAGLVEASSEPALRTTAIRAMGYARGYAQLPTLAEIAGAKNDEEARLALESAVELAQRGRPQEDLEDGDELSEGCDKLSALARDAKRPKDRRIPAIRAVRGLPCPKVELPTDLDAR